MSFTQEYQKKLTTADEAVKVVKSGDRLEYSDSWWYRYASISNHSD